MAKEKKFFNENNNDLDEIDKLILKSTPKPEKTPERIKEKIKITIDNIFSNI